MVVLRPFGNEAVIDLAAGRRQTPLPFRSSPRPTPFLPRRPVPSAYSRTSCVIFIEQKCGPHIEQKWASLAPSAGKGLVVIFLCHFRIERQG